MENIDLPLIQCGEFDAWMALAKGIVIVAFETAWNGSSQIMVPVLAKIKEMFGNEIQIGRIDMESCSEIAQRFQVAQAPSFLFFKNGELSDQVFGVVPKRELATIIFSLLKKSSPAAP